MRRTVLLLLALMSALPSFAGAQDEGETGVPTEETFSSPWRTSWFPFITGWSNDGPLLGARVRRWQPAPYEARTTFTGAVFADAGATSNGTRFARLQFDAPLLWYPWRFSTSAATARQARFGFFGLGNETTFDHDLVNDAQPYFYRVKRTRYRGQFEVSRYLRPQFLIAVLGTFESSRFSSLPGPSVFDDEFGPETLEEDDASARLAFIYDTRNVEYNPQRGLLLETGVQLASGGGNYTRLYAILRGYLSVREGTVVAARLAGAGMGGGPTLNSRYIIPGWEQEVTVLGGESSHRSFDTGRFAGRHVLFGNLEVRHDLLNLGDLGAVTLLAFTDAGRVFEDESFKLTLDGVKWGGGGGVALRIFRASIITFNFAGGPDGYNFSINNGWMF